MSNYSASISKYTTGKDGKEKYRVYFSYVSPKDGKRHRTCKRGFTQMNKATKWIQDDLANEVRKLEHKETLPEFMTMGELIAEYLEDAELDEDIEFTTMRTKRSNINNHILPYFKNLAVHKIEPKDVKAWQRQMKKAKQNNGKPYAQTYLRTVENQLSAIFNYAVDYYDLPKNPIVKRMGSKEAPEATIWELSMYRKFQREIEDKIEYYYAFEVFFWTGVRLGELLALTPSDIDFEKKLIDINKAMRYNDDGELVEGPPKGGKCRKIYISDFLLEELQEYLDSISPYDKNTRIFPLSKSEIHRVIDKYCVIADVPRITIHALRHSHTSMLEHLGIPRVAIKKRLGHSLKNVKDVTTTYIHSYDSTDIMVPRVLNEVALGKIDPNNMFETLLRACNKEVV